MVGTLRMEKMPQSQPAVRGQPIYTGKSSAWNCFSFPLPEAKIRAIKCALCWRPKAEWKHHSWQGPHPRVTKVISKLIFQIIKKQPQQLDGNEVVIPSFSLFKPQQKRRAPGQPLCQAISPFQCHRSLHYLLQKEKLVAPSEAAVSHGRAELCSSQQSSGASQAPLA